MQEFYHKSKKRKKKKTDKKERMFLELQRRRRKRDRERIPRLNYLRENTPHSAPCFLDFLQIAVPLETQKTA
jgi:hypothetical protein